MLRRIPWLALGLVLADLGGAAARAQEAAPVEDLAAGLEALRAEHDVPALAAAEVVGGRLTALGASGLRHQDRDAPVTSADRFHFGSNGKSVTATLIARLVEKGSLSWEAPLEALLPDHAAAMHPVYRSVTLVELLSHTAGVVENPSPALMLRLMQEGAAPADQRRLVVAEALAAPAEGRTRGSYAYSNVGVTLAGMAAAHAEGLEFEPLLRREVLEPLGMEGCDFGAAGSPGQTDQPWGHFVVPAGRPRAGERMAVDPGAPYSDNPPGIAPAGTLHAPLAAWARYLAAHLGQGPEGFLSRDSWRKLHTPVVDMGDGNRYALGWIVGTLHDGTPWIFHNGSNNMFFAYTVLLPTQGRALLAAANQGGTPGNLATLSALRQLLDRGSRAP